MRSATKPEGTARDLGATYAFGRPDVDEAHSNHQDSRIAAHLCTSIPEVTESLFGLVAAGGGQRQPLPWQTTSETLEPSPKPVMKGLRLASAVAEANGRDDKGELRREPSNSPSR